MPEALVMTSAYARTTVRTDCGSRGKKLSRVGNKVSPRHVRCVSFWRKINHFRGNQRIWTSKNLDWSFLCPTYDNIFANKFLKLFIALCLVTLQEQPSLPPLCLVKILTGWFTYKLMKHLEICLLTDLPTTGAYFSFQLTFKIIVFLSGSYRHKNGIQLLSSPVVFGFSSRKVPQRDFSMAAFVIVHAGSLGRQKEKSFWYFHRQLKLC